MAEDLLEAERVANFLHQVFRGKGVQQQVAVEAWNACLPTNALYNLLQSGRRQRPSVPSEEQVGAVQLVVHRSEHVAQAEQDRISSGCKLREPDQPPRGCR